MASMASRSRPPAPPVPPTSALQHKVRARLRHNPMHAAQRHGAAAIPHSHARPRTSAPTRLAQHAQHAQRAQQRRSVTAASVAAPPSSAGPSADAATAEGGEGAEAAPQVLAGRTVAVVGGGPGGMLCAAHLARLGATVDVFERHDPAAVDQSNPPAVWSIALGQSAVQSMTAAGLNPDFGPKWKFEGSAGRRAGSSPMFFGPWAGETPKGADAVPLLDFLATQRGIVAHLQAECERVYGDAVRVHYGMRAVDSDVCGGEVVLEDAAGERVARAFDMVVGADGATSAVRQLMQEQDKDLGVRVTHSAMGIVCTNVTSTGHPATYATLPTPSGAPFHAVPEGFSGSLDGCVVNFVFTAKGSNPNISSSIVAYRHGGAEVSFAMTANAEWLRGRHAGTVEELVEEFTAAYPQLPQLWLEEVAAFLHSEAAEESLRIRAPSFVTCSKIASGRAVLLGDAAHAVSPNLGMGCNAALQDSEVLSHACIAADGDITAAVQHFNKERLEEAHVLTHVSQRVDAAEHFKMHGNVLAAIAGLPYLLPQIVTMAGRVLPVPDFLKPGFTAGRLFHISDDWSGIKGTVRGYTAKLLAFAAAVLAVVSAVVWKCFSLITA